VDVRVRGWMPGRGRCYSPVPSAACWAPLDPDELLVRPTRICFVRTGTMAFATAIHVALELDTGPVLGGAAPGIHRQPSSGRLRPVAGYGTA